MRVRIVKESTIRSFISKYPDSKTGFNEWVENVRSANWLLPADILTRFNTASFLGNGTYRIVFNIAGNHYRMICKYQFGFRYIKMYIKWIGTHAEYSKLCKKGLQYEVRDY
jgi:mRNA interferase HigB